MSIKLSKIFGTSIKKLLARRNYLVIQATPENELQNLIEFLRPKATNLALLRIGGNGDGAYLVPDDLEGIDLCLSPGSNGVWNFEKELFDKFNITSSIVDRIESKPINLYPEIEFIESWLGNYNSSGFTTFDTWLEKYPTNFELMLQMDIEGFEYEALLNIPEDILNRIRIMVIEFHYSYRYLNSELFFALYKRVFDRLKEKYYVVHFHPNNSCENWNFGSNTLPIVYEVTLIRKDRVSYISGYSPVPHEFDRDCVPDLPSSIFKF